jgi:hypothetical protein
MKKTDLVGLAGLKRLKRFSDFNLNIQNSVEDIARDELDHVIFAIDVQNGIPELTRELVFLALDLQELCEHLVVSRLVVLFIFRIAIGVIRVYGHVEGLVLFWVRLVGPLMVEVVSAFLFLVLLWLLV